MSQSLARGSFHKVEGVLRIAVENEEFQARLTADVEGALMREAILLTSTEVAILRDVLFDKSESPLHRPPLGSKLDRMKELREFWAKCRSRA